MSVCPLKERSKGHRVVSLPIITYSDDTSGNHSKKWNKFDLWAMIFLLAFLARIMGTLKIFTFYVLLIRYQIL